jgi:hypothetical protein
MAVSQSPMGGVSDPAEGVARDWLIAIFINGRPRGSVGHLDPLYTRDTETIKEHGPAGF